MFQPFLARKIPFRELRGNIVEIFEHWDDLLAHFVESREGIDVSGHNANSVERDLAVETLRAQSALMASIVIIRKYF